jgi:transposase-like protein
MDHEGLQNKIMQIDEALVKRELGEVVPETAEETLNRLLDAEANELCKARRYEGSPDRVDTCAGNNQRVP